jgi:hypothetical protein
MLEPETAMIARVACASCVVMFACLVRADDLPTQDQLQKLADDRNWKELLKGTTRVLQLKGAAAEPYDRPVVWMLKAEAQLQENLFVAASESFENASKEDKIDPAVADRCVAMSEIMRKTDARGFRLKPTRTVTTVQPIDVKDPQNRPAAIKALFESELASLKQQLEREKKKPSLADIAKIAHSARDLPPLERAATQSADQTKAVVAEAGSLMASTVTTWVEKARTDLDRIRESANELVQVEAKTERERQRNDVLHRKRGLTSKDVAELKDITRECQRIADAYKAFVADAGEPGEDLAAIPPRVEATYAEAQNILDTDYTAIHRN